MPQLINISTQGVVEIKNLLSKDRAKALGRASFLIANTIQNQAKKNLKQKVYSRPVPWKRTGKGQQSITLQKIDPLTNQVLVGAWYLRLVEKGRGPIKPKNKKFLAFPLKGGRWVFTKKVKAVKANPFFAPAIETGREKAPGILVEQVRKLYAK